MANSDTCSAPVFQNLDRGVVLATLGGLVFNGADASLAGILLTAVAAATYALARNRIANMEDFEFAATVPAPPGIDLERFTRICKWLGGRSLFDGLLGDLVDPIIGGTPEAARQHIRATLWLTIRTRIKEKILTLLWLERFL